MSARRPPSRSRRRGGRRHRIGEAAQLMYTAAYLLNAPGTQQLLVLGGHEAGEVARHAAALVAERQWLSTAADAWRAAATDLHQAADELAGPAAALPGWDSSAAQAFRATSLAHVERLTALGDTYRSVADTMEGTAEEAGRVHAALLGCIHAAGAAALYLTDGLSPGAAAQAVAAAWLRGARALLDAWADRADQAAAAVAALHGAIQPDAANRPPAPPPAHQPAGDSNGVGQRPEPASIR